MALPQNARAGWLTQLTNMLRARDIRAASVGAGVKASRLQQWAVEWERFCLWIVTEYGDTDTTE